MEQMARQAEQVGARLVADIITAIDLRGSPFQAQGDSGDRYSADAVIIATGAQARWLGLPSERLYQGFGVSACATCDGFFFRGREVAVVGGGNAAVEEAMFLTNFASRVTVIHRRDRFRGEKVLHERLFRNPKIAVVWDSVVDEILGDGDGSPRSSARRHRCPLARGQDRCRNDPAGPGRVHRHRPRPRHGAVSGPIGPR